MLQGHVDVVPVGDLANWPGAQPFSARIEHGVLHGRGACDMKAGLAVNLAVARALHRSGVRTERRLALHSVVSEEDGGLGAFATLRRGHRGEVAVITEPTSGRLVTANAGALTFRIEVAGRAAHGSTRHEGVSALDAFWPVHLALRDLEARRNADRHPLFGDNPLPYGISVGTVSAGDWASSVPDLLVAEGRMGVRLGEEPELARAAFEDAVAAAAAADPWLRDHTPRVTWPGGQFASGPAGRRAPARRGGGRRGGGRHRRTGPPRRPRPTAPTCASTPGSAASRRCTTARATCGSRTPRASRCRSPRWSRWPGHWPWSRPAGSAPTERARSIGRGRRGTGRRRQSGICRASSGSSGCSSPRLSATTTAESPRARRKSDDGLVRVWPSRLTASRVALCSRRSRADRSSRSRSA